MCQVGAKTCGDHWEEQEASEEQHQSCQSTVVTGDGRMYAEGTFREGLRDAVIFRQGGG